MPFGQSSGGLGKGLCSIWMMVLRVRRSKSRECHELGVVPPGRSHVMSMDRLIGVAGGVSLAAAGAGVEGSDVK